MARPEIDWDDTEGSPLAPSGLRGAGFFLQAREGPKVVSLKVEKQQVSGLADFLDGLMEDLPPVDNRPWRCRRQRPLRSPDEADWVVGSLGITYQQSTDRLVLIAEELLRDEGEPPAQARFPMRREMVVCFIDRARQWWPPVGPVDWCGAPLEPSSGGWCPCVN
ncbi:MAG: hypothetical protein Ct9H300mP12_14620 [Acidimicrobiales bacterium]|nr:MAG: hypothetical protein Ct9H300mP12_14620 [Acidimicrobiales bacterium]